MFNAALIGVSGFGDVHYRDLMRETEAGRLRPVAATVINPDEEREKCERLRGLGCTLFADYREMLRSFAGRIDLCLIPTGIALHAPMTCAAVEAGANVLVEKPAAATPADVRAMRDAARRAGRFVAVGFQNFYDPLTLRIKDALLAGRIGRLTGLKAWALWPRLDSYYARNRWAGRLCVDGTPVYDSPFNNALAHYVMLMLYWAGESRDRAVTLDSIEAELYHAHAIESADTACLRIHTRRGFPVHFYATHASVASRGPEITLVGDAGNIHWTAAGATLSPGGAAAAETWLPLGDTLRPAMFDEVLAALAGRPARLCTLDVAFTQTSCTAGAHASSPCHELPAGLVTRTPEAGSVKTVIAGIDELILDCHARERLFSEAGAAWAVPARRVALENLA